VEWWVQRANKERVGERCIVIANTPPKLSLRVALALTGGAYHEAFHTLYSCRRDLRAAEVASIVLPRWAKVRDWSKFQEALLQWSNINEDIRIERRGREEFEGVLVKLADLQDFILVQEEQGAETIRDHGGKPGALSVLEGTFRDVGLGYNTNRQQLAMHQYKQDSPQAVQMVLGGPLTPVLREVISLSKTDDLGCLRTAMDALAVLAEHSKETKEDQQAQQGRPGDGQQGCPDCNAPADKLKVRPKSDGQGGKVPDEGIVTCTVCGWQDEVKVEAKPAQSSQGSGGKGPQFEGFEDPRQQDDGEKGGGSAGSEKGDGGAGDSPSTGGGEEGQSGTAGGGGESREADKGPGAGGGGDDENQGDETCPGGTPQTDDGAGEGRTGESGGPNRPDAEGGSGAGGYGYDDQQHPGNEDWSEVALDAVNQAEAGAGTHLQDNNSALEQAVGKEQDKEEKGIEDGEAPWKPYDPSLDEIIIVGESNKGRDHDDDVARRIIKSVTRESAFLRARLRTVVRSLELTRVYHGAPKGRRLSSRYLVDSVATIKGGKPPTKAFCVKSAKVDMSMACFVLVDESSSMSSRKKDAARIMVSLTEPFDALHCPTMAAGFRNGCYGCGVPAEEGPDRYRYHRDRGVIHDVFKMWHEAFNAIRYRFANTRAVGSTPMADGIQFALDCLSMRNETHRFLFVVTDGQPDGGHRPIIVRQCRLGREAGVHVIGVGMGTGARGVMSLFKDHVYADTISELPRRLIAKLNELVDIRGGKRGRRVKKTG